MRVVVAGLVLAVVAGLASPAAAERPRRRVVTTSSIVILEPIRFVAGTARIHRKSAAMLDALAATFVNNPDLLKIEVRAYGADVARYQHQLADRRARAIVDALVARKVERSRLVPRGIARPPPGRKGPKGVRSAAPSFHILGRASAPSRSRSLLEP